MWEVNVLICGIEAKTLFDHGSTHSYISPACAKTIDIPIRDVQFILTITTPVGKQCFCSTFYPDCIVKKADFDMPTNLILFDMYDFDVILEMDWLVGTMLPGIALTRLLVSSLMRHQ